jgi:hypothetical protein
MTKAITKRTKRGLNLAQFQLPEISSNLPFLPDIALNAGVGKPPGQQKMMIPPGLLPF